MLAESSTLEGPGGSPTSEGHTRWCATVLQWLLALDCPSQLVSVVSNFDSHRAQIAFDVPSQGLAADAPRGARARPGRKGRRAEPRSPSFHRARARHRRIRRNPMASRVTRLPRALEATDEDAARALLTALRTAPGLGLSVAIADRDDVANVLVDTVIGSPSAAVSGPGVLRIGDEFQIILTATPSSFDRASRCCRRRPDPQSCKGFRQPSRDSCRCQGGAHCASPSRSDAAIHGTRGERRC